jgi:hypothetical protein
MIAHTAGKITPVFRRVEVRINRSLPRTPESGLGRKKQLATNHLLAVTGK